MNNLNLKMCVTAMAVLSTMWLVGCGKKSSAVAVDQPVATEPAAIVKPAATVNAGLLGLYTGQFEPSDAYLKAKKDYDAYIKKTYGDQEEECCGVYISDLNEIPAPLRKYMYKTPLNGLYEFTSPNRLSFVLNDMRDDGTFTAISVAAGNQRDVTGTWEQTDKGIRLVGKEPGDKPVDGTFDLVLVEKENLLSGTWTSNAESATPKKFVLKKSEFKYEPKIGQRSDKDEYFDFGRSGFDKNPSVDVLKTADVENLTQPQIRMIRNLVFARHGYSFGSEDLRRVFEGYDWYMPRSNDVKADLTELEKKNLALLMRYEKYADKHYDEFGR